MKTKRTCKARRRSSTTPSASKARVHTRPLILEWAQRAGCSRTFTTGVNFLREHIKPSVRIHYVYTKAGKVPNVIPDEAAVWIWIRDSKRSGVMDVSERVKDIAKGAALMAGVSSGIRLNNGLYELLINETWARTLQSNMELIGTDYLYAG